MNKAPIYRERLNKLADFLDTEVPRAKFSFAVVMEKGEKEPLDALAAGDFDCGTVGCAVGWTPALFPNELEWIFRHHDGTYEVNIKGNEDMGAGIGFANSITGRSIRIFFGLEVDELDYLFLPYGKRRGNNLGYNVTPQDVAAHIRKFLAEVA